jgi:RRXRR protein
MFVPVLDHSQEPLMPTTPSRARRWIKSGKATAFWKGGIFCVRLNVEPSAREIQPIAVGIDPGSKREGYSIISAAHTYLNIQAEARDGVKDAETDSTRMRRTRRNRKTPCRKPRQNRKQSKRKLPPSTKARWQWKLRVARFLCQIFPISVFVVEDIAATTKKGKRRWNGSFSPLEVGVFAMKHATQPTSKCYSLTLPRHARCSTLFPTVRKPDQAGFRPASGG